MKPMKCCLIRKNGRRMINSDMRRFSKVVWVKVRLAAVHRLGELVGKGHLPGHIRPPVIWVISAFPIRLKFSNSFSAAARHLAAGARRTSRFIRYKLILWKLLTGDQKKWR